MKEIYIIVSGNITEGVVLYGPFKHGEAHDIAHYKLRLSNYNVVSISIDETNEELTEQLLKNEELHTVAIGDPFVSMAFDGLFSTRELAYSRASTLGTDWFLVPIKNLQKVLEKEKNFP